MRLPDKEMGHVIPHVNTRTTDKNTVFSGIVAVVCVVRSYRSRCMCAIDAMSPRGNILFSSSATLGLAERFEYVTA